MDQPLRISVTLPGGRFHGDDWPASPARLFRALVAGTMTGLYRARWQEIAVALRWLEGLPAPEIVASAARRGQALRISVPNNDMDIAAQNWQAGRHYDPASLRTMKQLEPFLLECDGPHVQYIWRDAEIDESRLEGLRHAVHSLHTLGWGVDMAFAEISIGADDLSTENFTRWTPSSSGEKVLPVPALGSLQDLQDTYRRFLNCLSHDGVNPDTRPSVYRLQGYRDGEARRASLVFELRTCNDNNTYSRPSETAMVVAAWFRHAVAAALVEEAYDTAFVNAVALGHAEEEQPVWRLSYLPIPSVGHQHADGRIRRVMITGPADVAQEVIQLLERKLHGRVLTDEKGHDVCRLVVAENRKVAEWYLRQGTSWETVTPVVLHGHNASRGQISNHKTERLLFQAFAKAGFAAHDIAEITFQPAPLWPNIGSARSFRVPAHLNGWPRYHVSVTFRKPVRGPVIAGLGCHYGIGTLASSK